MSKSPLVHDPRRRVLPAKSELISPVPPAASTSFLQCLSPIDHRQSRPRDLQKHPRFWDATGDLILQIQNTLFRVHGSRLARHSRLFVGASSASGQKQVDMDGSSLPVLALVAPSDFEVLLDAMENAVTYHKETPSFQYIAALLRVSTILQFTEFRQFAIHILEQAWPSSLAAFSVNIPWPEHAAATLSLAKDCSVPGVVKRASYTLLMTLGFSCNPADLEILSKEDIMVLCRAREYLSRAWLLAAVVPDNSPCQHPGSPLNSPPTPGHLHSHQFSPPSPTPQCPGVQRLQLLNPVGLADFAHNPIPGLVLVAAVALRLKEQGVLCSWCYDRKWQEVMGKREEIWVGLDQVLGLIP
ncbi:hypothetical protein FIBSPDRAFT_861762 [Athelia psychrophila]|uniref:BTB domain-containing protein n=1 Tax=Athelia psychrophila TaxID=1759441 RepID=A0A166IWI7_9AGAM|nr:hypothetical protein FIBSPDRAFT_861762 [Fibularhizoctonia sp. CBS 109695]